MAKGSGLSLRSRWCVTTQASSTSIALAGVRQTVVVTGPDDVRTGG